MTILVPDIVEANGKTIRENNLELKHRYPIGSLVEVSSDFDQGDNGLRLFVVRHSRDCDGEPLYDLSFNLNIVQDIEEAKVIVQDIIKSKPYQAENHLIFLWSLGHAEGQVMNHYGEASLKLISLPKVVD